MEKKVSVIGSGLMGSGIAQVFAYSGFNTVLIDIKESFVENALSNIEKQLERMVEKNKCSADEKNAALSRIKISTNYDDAIDSDLVVEAVNENMEIKKEVFRKLDSICNEKTILASNTSTLSIASLASVTNRADKVIGMHFFIPAPVMKLVEIIPSINTSLETLNVIKEVSDKLNKISVTAKDFPGFIVNRIFVPMWNEAMFLVMEGIDPKDIDNAMKYGANLPMGPLELADFAGLDTVLSVMNTLYDGFKDSKFRPCPLLVKKVESGNLGRKTGKGFYDYK
ncbi:3-hydroxyacyl-CoA dehydrogenase NAD-binding domain-containing protein [Brachyspira pilosicoli]|uniref:3-hydroxybutyryl-CoA dehydrogenase n=2 Tax=Brachyspira pilosicoli TaxID=52584 RepID=D8IBW2_BRAP9|nr:3-hydroxyacyl-CoA dehydrogenase NAD-binding domain-containing protein [Brachyspira pilosicoli]ADK30635.1 3-hydroxybutyryl-CoA dehydrogenase [Brachyspira pilosicoli 95/1000]